MSSSFVEGGYPLEGEVTPSGSKDSAIKLIISSLFCNEDSVLENIPRTHDIEILEEIIKSIRGSITWVGDNKLVINGANISTHEISYEIGSRFRFSPLLAGPLLYRFGKALIPKPLNSLEKSTPINRWVITWQNLGINVESDEKFLILDSLQAKETNIIFKISTHNGTANAILSSIFINGNTYISNAAEESEIDELIEFINKIGGLVERVEPRKIKITGTNIFHGAYHEIKPDIIEAISYAAAAIITKGNITIKGIKDLQIASFVNFLTKINTKYEFNNNELKVWYGGEIHNSTTVESSPAPGFLADWLPFVTLIQNYADGISLVHNTIYYNRMGYIQDFNRMGANIEIKKPSEVGLSCVISDESYDFEKLGEPKTVAQINGPQKLKGLRLNMTDTRYDSVLILAALSAEGRSELVGVEEMAVRYERYFDKLINLGAHLT
ncbi:hypothetical protein A2V49_00970 [candidate division WWE3 bacterium RBG_19FT_COMBO_34_6]|uniref:UDP-N-acetylglucosamine 1-carboxyvinyltransferase n=1 Tax=candidate division WWE3 bacterium RBG_19FT_COMBO_34_6 TaxID=1802612 RepID=A0A1F4UKY4_UNCKA|nr:MAG: hypothetical protein A2V49_00970 [candidate division WWE3 bacterium RBG_19FT_COMBO_34_6]